MSSESAVFPTDLLWFMDGDVTVEEGNRGGKRRPQPPQGEMIIDYWRSMAYSGRRIELENQQVVKFSSRWEL